MPNEYHKSVLIDAVVEALNVASVALIADVCLGDGGHAKALLENAPHLKVIGIDQDAQAVDRASERLTEFGSRFVPVHGNFRDLALLLNSVSVQHVDGIVADLGVSMLQITHPARGFMFSEDGPLDMRMNPIEQHETAEDVVNELDEKELADIIYQYGEERQSRRIARYITAERQKNRIHGTKQLADIVRKAVGERFVIKSLARVFQALRIYINHELENLEFFLDQSLAVLNHGGRLAVIDYHSLEAKIVKRFIQREEEPCICPKDIPVCVCGRQPRLKFVHKLVKPSAEEIDQNPSARSARLRVAEKL